MFSNLPTLDLHGEYRDSARILINEFIDDSYKLGYEKVIIVHGIGKGILKDEVKKTLDKVGYNSSNGKSEVIIRCTGNKEVFKVKWLDLKYHTLEEVEI